MMVAAGADWTLCHQLNSWTIAPMKSAGRILLGIVAGMGMALALVVAVEWFSSVVHPFPANFNGNIPEHVRHYPDWVLGAVVLAWGATIAVATWVASGIVVSLLLAWALISNLTMLPYTMWFKVAMLCAFPVACLLGVRYGRRIPSPVAVTDAALRSRREPG
jgi:MFS family permease